MKWGYKDPSYGDMIRVGLGEIYHVGIYVSDDEIIQFGLAPSMRALLRDSEIEVLSSDIDTFLAGGFLEVAEFDKKEKKKHRSPKEVVAYARSKIGTRGYNILYNNCEHFATACITGVATCSQGADVRALFRNMPVVDVYLAVLPEKDPEEPLETPLRQQELQEISNPRVVREKYYAWKLLGYGLQRSFGLKIQDLAFQKGENGQYITERAKFSISHAGKALAVVISRSAVGVDIEPANAPYTPEMAERILATGETVGDFVKLWTAKEALFKQAGEKTFEPRMWNTTQGGFVTYEKTVGDGAYILSIATQNPEKIRFYENISL